uniref:Uncharacterized protein n=1 Tax=Oryza barthii TaxID=65489 RepID=A0A0D3HIZ3_9ORYZ
MPVAVHRWTRAAAAAPPPPDDLNRCAPPRESPPHATAPCPCRRHGGSPSLTRRSSPEKPGPFSQTRTPETEKMNKRVERRKRERDAAVHRCHRRSRPWPEPMLSPVAAGAEVVPFRRPHSTTSPAGVEVCKSRALPHPPPSEPIA